MCAKLSKRTVQKGLASCTITGCLLLGCRRAGGHVSLTSDFEGLIRPLRLAFEVSLRVWHKFGKLSLTVY